ncbi:MAG: hypothetical protein FJ167_03870 [Gammaproteobacteria bacterium]|nr:hypothetical protein [Gammaproteobacteria bacterium]
MNAEIEFKLLALRFMLCSVFLICWTLSARVRGTGLLLGYWLHFLQNYGVAGLMHALAWTQSDLAGETLVGFREAELGLECFCLGALLVTPLLRRMSLSDSQAEVLPEGWRWPSTGRVFWVGIVMGYALNSVIIKIPSGMAVSSTLATLTAAAWALATYRALQAGRLGLTAALGAGTVVFPISTMLFHGFIGFGVNSMILILCLVAAYLRPRWFLIPLGVVTLFLGMSVYVTYMRDRGDIRASVWGGDEMVSRVTVLTATFSRFDWFDPLSDEQMRLIDSRMNQNWLFGLGVERLQRGEVDFKRGDTVLDAVVAVVPRALWPDKPMVAGSGNLVSHFTGMQFTEGTSIGIGPIMEFYANFGRAGVVIASLLIGGFLGLCDRMAGLHLRLGHTTRFAAWLLLGIPLLQALGSLISISTSLATGAVLFFVFKGWWQPAGSSINAALPPSQQVTPAPSPQSVRAAAH